ACVNGALIGVAVIVVALAIPSAVFLWARRLSHRPGVPRFVAAFPPLILILGAINMGVPMYFVAGAFGQSDTSEKATLLAKGISEAMNCYAFLLIVLIAIAIVLGIISARARRARSPR